MLCEVDVDAYVVVVQRASRISPIFCNNAKLGITHYVILDGHCNQHFVPEQHPDLL